MHYIIYAYALVFLLVETVIVGVWFEKVWYNREGFFTIALKTIPFAIVFLVVYKFSLTFDAVCILNLFFAPAIGICIYIIRYNFA